jgi:hypothetical protein
MKRLLILAGLVLETIACGSTTTDGPGSGGSGDTAGGSAGSGAAAHAGSGAGAMAAAGSAGTSGQCGTGCVELCEGGLCSCSCAASCEGFASPALGKSCATDDDCFAGVHILDCCGSQIVLGYNLSVQSSFDEYEADCTSRALCRCAPAEPTIEGGQVTSDIELRRAVCSGGQCLGTGPVNVGDP